MDKYECKCCHCEIAKPQEGGECLCFKCEEAMAARQSLRHVLDMPPAERRIHEESLTRFGPTQQMDVAQEELAELIVALSKWKRGTDQRLALMGIIEETADVLLSLRGVWTTLGFSIPQLYEMMDWKYARLKARIEDANRASL